MNIPETPLDIYHLLNFVFFILPMSLLSSSRATYNIDGLHGKMGAMLTELMVICKSVSFYPWSCNINTLIQIERIYVNFPSNNEHP